MSATTSLARVASGSAAISHRGAVPGAGLAVAQHAKLLRRAGFDQRLQRLLLDVPFHHPPSLALNQSPAVRYSAGGGVGDRKPVSGHHDPTERGR